MTVLQPIKDPYLGQLIDGQWKLNSVIGGGGVGTVYLARQAVTERPAAVKVIHPQLVNDELLGRFQQEATAISRLMHPNIVTVYAYGQHSDGALYIAMEHIEGETLAKRLNKERVISVERALPLILQLAEALAFAHEQRVIHRDVRPENIILTTVARKEVPKLVDFSIVKLLDKEMVKTRSGMQVGAPPFMAPEQWLQQPVDGRTDIYALGCVFYLLVTGRLPFVCRGPGAYYQAHINDTPRWPSQINGQLSYYPGLDEVIVKCLAKKRDERFWDCYQLVEVLSAFSQRLPTLRNAVPPKVAEARSTDETMPPVRVGSMTMAPSVTPTPTPVVAPGSASMATQTPSSGLKPATDPRPVAPAAPPPSEAMTAPHPSAPTPKNPNRLLRWIVFVLITIAAGALVFWGVGTLMKRRQRRKPAPRTEVKRPNRVGKPTKPPAPKETKLVQPAPALVPKKSIELKEKVRKVIQVPQVTKRPPVPSQPGLMPGPGDKKLKPDPPKPVGPGVKKTTPPKPAPTPAKQPLPPKAAPKASSNLMLTIKSRPKGARVLVDGKLVGTTPLLLRPSGKKRSIKLTLKRRGFRARTKIVVLKRFKGGKKLVLMLKLRKRKARKLRKPPDKTTKKKKKKVVPEDW